MDCAHKRIKREYVSIDREDSHLECLSVVSLVDSCARAAWYTRSSREIFDIKLDRYISPIYDDAQKGIGRKDGGRVALDHYL